MPASNPDHPDDPFAAGAYPAAPRAHGERTELMVKAFDLYMNDPRRPTLIQIARELRLEPAALHKHAQNKGWEQLRLQQTSIVSTVQNEKRLAIARQVDEQVVFSAHKAIDRATGAYLEALDHIAALPVDPMDVPDEELDKDDHGNVKNRPKKSRLLEQKVFLLNQAMDGFMKMANGAQGIGLVLAKTALNPNQTATDLNNLSKLNVLLLNIQQGKDKSEPKPVEEARDV